MDPDEAFSPEKATELTAAEAKQCLKRKGTLSFDRLPAITPDAALVVAQHPDGVELDSLVAIDQRVAEALATATGGLGLDGVREVNDATAAALARTRGPLTMEGLVTLVSVPLAKKLATQGGLHLPKVRSFQNAVADAIASCRCPLRAPSLEVLDHEGLGRALAAGGGLVLHLHALTHMTGSGARGLCAQPCDLYLPSIKKLDADAAKAIGNHAGVLDCDNLVHVEPELLEAVFANQGPIGLGSLASLGNPAPVKVLDALARHGWPLCLSGLPSLTEAEAEALRRRRGHVDLAGIKKLTLPTATQLVNANGMIWLMGLEALDPGVPEVLLKHRPRDGTGFVLPNDLRPMLAESDVVAFERHEGIHFGNDFNP